MIDLSPESRASLDGLAEGVSGHVGRAHGVAVHLSPTMLGLPAVGMAVMHLIMAWSRRGGVARPIAAAPLAGAWLATSPWIAPGAVTDPMVASARAAASGVGWLVLAVVIDLVAPGRRGPAARSSPRAAVACDAVACAAAAFAGVCLVGTSMIGPPSGRSILVHNRGGLDWDRPVFGRFGAFSGGMFGLLPVYCRAEGYEFGVIDKDAIGDADLANAQILILINSPKPWDDSERRAVSDFVARGGSLLVLGDHTDVFGLMKGFNGLTADYGIRFRFDSAYKLREQWRGCEAASAVAVALGWDEENPSVAVGASLELSGAARPLLTGRYGFSDAGVRENFVGSFLGNYHYENGERLGDVTLVATATRGRGRVVVWGDTTAFQGGLSLTYARVIGPLLAWLSRPAAWTERPPARTAAAIGLAAAIAWLAISRARPSRVLAVGACLLAGLAIPWALSLPNRDARARIDGDTILVDQSHLPATGHYEARVNPVGPLYTNLLRSGFRVVDMERWDAQGIGRARGIAFVAPQRPFGADEIGQLLRAEESGAVVLMAVGQPDSAATAPVLAAHGLAAGPAPSGDGLGRRPDREPARARAAAPGPGRLADRDRRRRRSAGAAGCGGHLPIRRRRHRPLLQEGPGGTPRDRRHPFLLRHERRGRLQPLARQPRPDPRPVPPLPRRGPG